MAVKDGSGEKDADGNDKRNLRVFDNADVTPVLNLEPIMMQVYNNGFQVIYNMDDIFIKTYGIRSGLICVLCTRVNDKLIPYNVLRTKKKDTELEISKDFPTVEESKLNETADLEKLQLLYKQSGKAVDSFSTIESVLDWLIKRQSTLTDINHHLQIDNVIIEMMK
jgi:hypothetical protein